jgi:hypothetical protein
MTQHEAAAAIDRALDRLAAQLDAGRSQAMTDYLKAMSAFHRYSWGNQLLIFVQRPDATRVAGYTAWQRMGRQVRQGEHGITILAPCTSHRCRPDGEEEEEDRAVRHFRSARVFDIAQTDGRPLPEPPSVSGDPGPLLGRLEAFAARERIRLEYLPSLGPGVLGRSTGGAIAIVTGLPPARAFGVLAHEVAHELLHWSLPEERRRDRRLVETQAEAVAGVVCATVGLETGTSSSDYIGLYNGSRETLRLSLAAIHHAAGRILKGILPPEPPPAAEPTAHHPRQRSGARVSPLCCAGTVAPRPRVGDYVLVRDIPEGAVFIDDSREVRLLNVAYARKQDEYAAFFVLGSDGAVEAVWGLHGIVPWADRETVLVYLHPGAR